jgi:nicotinamidase/pyrazinamidase
MNFQSVTPVTGVCEQFSPDFVCPMRHSGHVVPAHSLFLPVARYPASIQCGRGIMLSPDFIFWEVDVQRDFMLPGGKLYAPGAEKLLPNIRKLTDAARRGQVLLVSSGDFHPPNDPEFRQFPPHCVMGTPGSELLPEALADKVVRVENLPAAKLPDDAFAYQQIILEKQTLDVFQTLHADELVESLGSKAEFVVFGVVTEYCVACAVKGLLQRKRRVAVVQDAIQTLAPEVGAKALVEFQRLGARLVTTEMALASLSS